MRHCRSGGAPITLALLTERAAVATPALTAPPASTASPTASASGSAGVGSRRFGAPGSDVARTLPVMHLADALRNGGVLASLDAGCLTARRKGVYMIRPFALAMIVFSGDLGSGRARIHRRGRARSAGHVCPGTSSAGLPRDVRPTRQGVRQCPSVLSSDR